MSENKSNENDFDFEKAFIDAQSRLKQMQQKKSRKTSVFLNYLSMSLAIFGGVAISYLMEYKISNKVKDQNEYEQLLKGVEIRGLQEQISELKYEIEKSNNINYDSLNSFDSKNIILNKLMSDVINFDTKVKKLENIILENPEKAVSIPIMKVEIENLKEQNDKVYKEIKDEIARVYDMNKWIIGLVVGLIGSIIILNISNLYSKPK